MNPRFTQLFLMVVHPPAQKHASFCLAQETPLMLQSLQRTVNVTLQGGAMLMDKGRQGPLCVKDSKAKSCRSWTSGGTNVTMKIDDDIKMSPEFMNENECSCLPSWANKSLNLSVSIDFHRIFTTLKWICFRLGTWCQEQRRGTTCFTCFYWMSSLLPKNHSMTHGCSKLCGNKK